MTKATKKHIIAITKYAAGSITSIVSGIFGVASIIAGAEAYKTATDKKERKDLRQAITGGILVSAASIVTGIATSSTYERDLDDIKIEDYAKEEKKLFADEDEDVSYTSLSPEFLEAQQRKEDLNKRSGFRNVESL